MFTGWDNVFQLKSAAYTSDPYCVLINPRNMKITETCTVYSGGQDSDAYNLALKNK